MQLPSDLWYKRHLSRQWSCWSIRCSWSFAYRHCSNYIFILDLTPGFNGLDKDNCRTRQESFQCCYLVHLILEVLQQVLTVFIFLGMYCMLDKLVISHGRLVSHATVIISISTWQPIESDGNISWQIHNFFVWLNEYLLTLLMYKSLSYLEFVFNTLRPRQNGCCVADDTFDRIFVNENARIPIKISLKFVP